MSTMPPEVVPLGASTLNRDWRIDVDTSGSTALPVITATSGTAALTSATAHGLSVGQTVTFSSIQAPFVAGTTYYVISVGSSTTFTLSATSGGSALTPTASGTLAGVRGPTWTIVRGRTDFKPSLDSDLQDDSDMDSGGYKSQTKTAEQWSLELKVARKATKDSVPTYDLGQETLRLAAQNMGPANTVHVRWYKLGAIRTEAYEGYAACAYAPEGGDMTGLDTATITLTGQGKRLLIAHPYTG